MYVPQTNPIHLYRAILRESSYLFDAVARKSCEERVRKEFRKKRAQLFDNASAHKPFPRQVELHQLKRARKFLSFLTRANLGHRRPVENVLALAYARKGAGRQKIVSCFKIRDEEENTDSIADHASRKFEAPRAFQGLLKAQRPVNNHLKRSGSIVLGPDVPETNRLGDPFPQSRVRKVNVTWHQRQTDLLSVPLPGSTWNRVADHVYRLSGKALKPVPRRPQALQKVYAAGKDEENTQPRLLEKTRREIGNPHRLTHRFLRRRLQHVVLANTPTPLARLATSDTVYRWSPGPQVLPVPQLLTESQTLLLFG